MSAVSSKTGHTVFALSLLWLVAEIDLATGVEISVFPLYLVPLVWAVWFADLSSGMWLSLAATLVRRWIDHLEGHDFSHWWILLEVGLANFVTFAFIAFSFHIFKRGRKTDHDRIQRLEEMLRVCPACNRVRHGAGIWKNLEACLAEPEAGPPESRLCPECSDARPPTASSL